ncbi:MAG: hypothetical protein Tsb0020_36250 [Haliangiales bacterium]
METDVGVVREHNEDSAHVDSSRQFFIVADGMGGHAAGEVASNMAVEMVCETLAGSRSDIDSFAADPDEDGRKQLVTLLETAVRAAHRAVFERGSRESDKQGMGTTLEVVLVAGSEAFIAHVGDSRTYLIRDEQAAQITTDHTVAEVLVLEGKLSAEEAQMSPLRTILVNAIGVAPDVGIEMAHVQLRTGDQLLLSSDGLHDYFTDEQELARRLDDRVPEEALHELVELAKDRGGHDNITGIVVRISDDSGDDDSSGAAGGVPDNIDDEPLSDGIPSPLPTLMEDAAGADTMPVDQNDRQKDGPFPGLRNVSATESDDGASGTAPSEVRSAADRNEDDEAHRTTQPMDIIRPEQLSDSDGDDAKPDDAKPDDAKSGDDK